MPSPATVEDYAFVRYVSVGESLSWGYQNSDYMPGYSDCAGLPSRSIAVGYEFSLKLCLSP